MRTLLKRLWVMRVRRSVILGVAGVAFLIGLALGAGVLRLYGWPWVVLAGMVVIGCVKRRLVIAIPAVCLAFILLGVWRASEVQIGLGQYQSIIGQKLEINGNIKEDPSYDDEGRLDFRVQQVRVAGRELPGEVRVKTFAPVQPRRGDVVQVYGKLQSGFGNYQAAIYFAEVRVQPQPAHLIDEVRRRFAASVLSYIPEPSASLGLGFVIGLKSQLPAELEDQLKVVGLTHIVVASGYNLTILVRLGRRIFAKRSKYQALVFSGALIAAFLVVTGFSPSMSRAGLVGGISLVVWYFGLTLHPLVLLNGDAAINAGVYPPYLWGDLGWWLSFMAFAGVMLLAPVMQRRLFGEREPKLIGQVLLETTCAQIATLPLILCMFGNLSVLALLANLIVVPLIPLAMALTFLAGITGLVVPWLAGYAAIPASVLLGYIVEIVKLLASFPWATTEFFIGSPVMLGLYAAIAIVWIILWRRTQFSYLHSSIVD